MADIKVSNKTTNKTAKRRKRRKSTSSDTSNHIFVKILGKTIHSDDLGDLVASLKTH